MKRRDKCLAPTDNVRAEEHEGKLLLYCDRTSKLYPLDPFDSVVWALCDGERDFDSIVSEVMEISGGLRPEIEREVKRATREFCRAGLLE